MLKRYITIAVCALLIGCGKNSEKTVSSTPVDVPGFNADSAYAFVQKQVDFGPRVPNTEAHRKTSAYLEQKLKSYGASVSTQSFQSRTFDGTTVELKNIIASFNPEKQKRILIAAHWDTRPFADKDTAKPNAPLDGANDGASGIGVLLEIARQMQAEKPRAGVDLILFDGEDWGGEGKDDSWCLGSQYWSKNPHKPGYRAYFGIVIDMVGAKDARFFREGHSMQYAPRIVEKVWAAGQTLGYTDYFISQEGGAITDDHVFINEITKIPVIDIIDYDPNKGFGSFHHTTGDNMSVINKRTLEVVGTTVLYVAFQEE